MKRKLILISFTVILLGLFVGASTFAYFTDSAHGNTKNFQAGTIDIDSYRDGFDTIPGPMFYTTAEEGATPTDPSYPGLKPTGQWAPGDTHIRSLVVYNKGSLDAILSKVKAEVISDPENLASKLNVAIYNIVPENLPNGTPFSPIPGDDTLDQELLNYTSNLINPFIMTAHYFGTDELTQKFIESRINVRGQLLWSGKMSDLTSEYKKLNKGLSLKSNKAPQFRQRGCLLAFVVQLDKAADNNYQGAEAKFGFTLLAEQKK